MPASPVHERANPLSLLPDLQALRDAQQLVREAFASTPQYRWPLLEARAGGPVWVKHENHTPVGAFNVRGGVAYLHWRLAAGDRPLGLGSGACDALATARALAHPVELVGVMSARAPAYARSLASGRLESRAVSTRLADGMACRTPDATALSILQSAGVRVIEVTDAQVADALRVCFSATHNVAEGAGAAGLAALLAAPERSVAEVCGTVLYGGNRFSAVFVRVLAEGGAA